MVLSDPVMVKHVLKTHAYKYDKGVLAEILEPIMGKGACVLVVDVCRGRDGMVCMELEGWGGMLKCVGVGVWMHA